MRWWRIPGSLARMLFVAEPYRPLFHSLGLQSCEAVSRHFLGANPPRLPRVLVRPSQLPGPGAGDAPLEVFFKEYRYARPAWQFIARHSKARCEFANYEVFSRLNLRAAEAIAVGEDRDAVGRLRRAFIITRAVPSAQTLFEFFEGPGRDRTQASVRSLRRQVLQQLAAMTRRIHDAHFYHHDLYWRNVLVTTPPSQPPAVWWIDCPRGGFVRWRAGEQRRRLKDLAALDKPAGRWCTRGERVQFIRDYAGLRRLDAAAKQLIRDALRYRKHRWPEDWDGI